ncbi:hypothetical protein FRC03_000728 [Tulasnella sp. 419]|nr:hypothetical protein FRC02_006076 [Tulasnella sp. 418]KAG8948383.1 hypothetical protein FRC03_000728 [Tulasnella sp. 419]
MVYIASWQQFQRDAEALYARSPRKARYCVKWRSKEGSLVLKLTDDTTCLKYKTTSSIFLNRFEALNLALMEKMQNRRIPPPSIPLPSQEIAQATAGGGPGASDAVQASTAAASAASKKKKPKKKK